jgi:hypothetical protein
MKADETSAWQILEPVGVVLEEFDASLIQFLQ